MPLTAGLASSVTLSSTAEPSSLTSRFRFVEELMDWGEPGRGETARPLACGTATSGDAIFCVLRTRRRVPQCRDGRWWWWFEEWFVRAGSLAGWPGAFARKRWALWLTPKTSSTQRHAVKAKNHPKTPHASKELSCRSPYTHPFSHTRFFGISSPAVQLLLRREEKGAVAVLVDAAKKPGKANFCARPQAS